MEDDYNWDEDDEGPSDGGEGGLANEGSELPTIDSKSGRVMSKPRKSGSPLEWLLGVRQSGFSPSGGQPIVSKKKGKGKKFAPESEEEEFPESEEYDEELTNDEDWDEDEEAGSRYAPINTKIAITKVRHPKLE